MAMMSSPHPGETIRELCLEPLGLRVTTASEPDLRLEELRREIQKGIDSCPETPLNIEEIKARGRKRLAAQQVVN